MWILRMYKHPAQRASKLYFAEFDAINQIHTLDLATK